jgi:hypothetical protein
MNTSYKLSAMEYGKPGAVHTQNFYRESTEKFNFSFIGAIVSLQTIKIQISGAGVSRSGNINNLLKQIMPHLMGLIYVLQQMVITSTLLQ